VRTSTNRRKAIRHTTAEDERFCMLQHATSSALSPALVAAVPKWRTIQAGLNIRGSQQWKS
jgi:hypothetical protein